MTAELIVTSEDTALCICGNETHKDGFYSSDPDGMIREDLYGPESEWDGTTTTCLRCGRTFDWTTGEVLGRTSPEIVAGALAYMQ